MNGLEVGEGHVEGWGGGSGEGGGSQLVVNCDDFVIEEGYK